MFPIKQEAYRPKLSTLAIACAYQNGATAAAIIGRIFVQGAARSDGERHDGNGKKDGVTYRSPSRIRKHSSIACPILLIRADYAGVGDARRSLFSMRLRY
jgi:hypothetical protein